MSANLGPAQALFVAFKGTASNSGAEISMGESVSDVLLPIDDLTNFQWNTNVLQQNGIGVYQNANASAAWGATVMESGLYRFEFLFEANDLLLATTPGDQCIPYFTVCATSTKQPLYNIIGASTQLPATPNPASIVSVAFNTTRVLVPPTGGLTITVGLCYRVTSGGRGPLSANASNAYFTVSRLSGVGQQLPGVYT